MENPFESGHIRNYLLLYASVVVIMVLFFIASTLFNDVKQMEKKVFDTNILEETRVDVVKKVIEVNASRFKLMPKVY